MLENEAIEWMKKHIPKDASPREVAILICYHLLNIKDPNTLYRVLHYKDNSTVHRKLKKYRNRVYTINTVTWQ